MTSIGKLFDETVEQEKYRQTHPEEFRGWSWCIPDLNRVVGRMQAGWDIRVSGTPKIGKTAFMVSQALSMMREGAGIFYLSLEESEHQIMLRMISNLSGIERRKFRELLLGEAEWGKVEEISPQVHSYRGVLEGNLRTLDDLDKRVCHLTGLDAIFIDHMNLLEPSRRTDNFAQAMGEISREIKLLTRGVEHEPIQTPKALLAAEKQDVEQSEWKPHEIVVVTAVHLNDDGQYLWTRGTARDGDVILKIHPMKDAAGNEVVNQRSVEVALSRHSVSGDTLKVFINGALSLVAGLVEEKVDINQRANQLLDTPWKSQKEQ